MTIVQFITKGAGGWAKIMREKTLDRGIGKMLKAARKQSG
jgi:hypothetical protein